MNEQNDGDVLVSKILSNKDIKSSPNYKLFKKLTYGVENSAVVFSPKLLIKTTPLTDTAGQDHTLLTAWNLSVSA